MKETFLKQHMHNDARHIDGNCIHIQMVAIRRDLSDTLQTIRELTEKLETMERYVKKVALHVQGDLMGLSIIPTYLTVYVRVCVRVNACTRVCVLHFAGASCFDTNPPGNCHTSDSVRVPPRKLSGCLVRADLSGGRRGGHRASCLHLHCPSFVPGWH